MSKFVTKNYVACAMIVLLHACGAAQAGVISIHDISSDNWATDCGISTANTYTHAVNFDANSASGYTTVNSVNFYKYRSSYYMAEVYNTQTSYTGYWKMSALSGKVCPASGNYSGQLPSGSGLYNLMYGMLFTGDTTTPSTKLEITGLTAGQNYSLRLYYRNWDSNNQYFDRTTRLVFNGDGTDAERIVNQDAGGAHYIEYCYNAAGNAATVYFYVANSSANGWHMYAMSNQTIASVPEPGTLTLLSAGLIGLLAYAWRKRK